MAPSFATLLVTALPCCGFRFATATLPLPWPNQAREAMHADLRPLIRPLNVLEPDGG